ncbi:MAG TPA: response regulator transcription factor [Lacibacter sp.]|nr:response regulator transcription factor [Lacibacter sp.]
MIRLVIYEDNDQLRKSMQMLLTSQPQFEVAGAFADANNIEAEMKVLEPDLAVLDIDMPGRKGTDAVALVKTSLPSCKVVMHTVFEDDEKLFASLCAGADGYLLKKTPPERFILYLTDVMEGGAPFSPGVAQKVLQFFQKRQEKPEDPFNLTQREKQILELLVKGYTYKAISAELDIALDTSRKHIRHIYEKLHVNSGREAVALAIKHRLSS